MSTTTQHQFTKDQLADYLLYEEVRASGAYNMFDPRARASTGLSRDEYRFVMDNFTALRAAYESMVG